MMTATSYVVLFVRALGAMCLSPDSVTRYRTTSVRGPLEQYALLNSTSPFYKSSVIVRPLDQYAPIRSFNAFGQVKILYHCYSYSKSRFPCSKMPEISRNCSKLELFIKKCRKIDLTNRLKSDQRNSTPSRIVRPLEQYALSVSTNLEKFNSLIVSMRTNRGSTVYKNLWNFQCVSLFGD